MSENKTLTEEQAAVLEDVILNLDPRDSTNWTKDGLPKIDAISAVFGSAVTRAMIEQVVDTYNREEAFGEHEVLEEEKQAILSEVTETAETTKTPDAELSEDLAAPNPGKNDPIQAPIPGVSQTAIEPEVVETSEEKAKRFEAEQKVVAEAEKAVEKAQAEVNATKEKLLVAQANFEKAIHVAEKPIAEVSLAEANASFFAVRDIEAREGTLSVLDRGFGGLGEVKPKRPQYSQTENQE